MNKDYLLLKLSFSIFFIPAQLLMKIDKNEVFQNNYESEMASLAIPKVSKNTKQNYIAPNHYFRYIVLTIAILSLIIWINFKQNQPKCKLEQIQEKIRYTNESKNRQKSGMKIAAQGTVQHFQYLRKNSEGKQIDEVLYNQTLKRRRRTFQDERIVVMRNKKELESFYLATFNNKINNSRDSEQELLETEQYKRINKIWKFQKYPYELPMCVIVPSYNNNANYRIEYNLNSIFQQNYSNFFVVIINDASTDGSDQIYQKYFDFYQIDKSMYVYVENPSRLTALENYYNAVHKYCSADAIGVGIDGDDEFIGKNVLKVFNAGYQKYRAGVLWSNFYWYQHAKTVNVGFTQEYHSSQKKGNLYRRAPQKFSHLRTFRCQLFLQIDKNIYFTDQNGNFYKSAYDMAMMLPLLELSCGRNRKIDGFHYLYNINTGLNDYHVSRVKQIQIDIESRKKPRLCCDMKFYRKMKK